MDELAPRLYLGGIDFIAQQTNATRVASDAPGNSAIDDLATMLFGIDGGSLTTKA